MITKIAYPNDSPHPELILDINAERRSRFFYEEDCFRVKVASHWGEDLPTVYVFPPNWFEQLVGITWESKVLKAKATIINLYHERIKKQAQMKEVINRTQL